MIPITEIDEKIVSCDSSYLPEDMIGAAFYKNPDGVQHAAIFFTYNGEPQLFHFDGKDVIIEPLSPQEIYWQKRLDFLDPILLPSFFAHCELILENARPKFGYFYDGALYTSEGNFISPQDHPQYMTCVGFCLSVIKGFLSDQDFFSYQDWDFDSLAGEINFVERFLEKVRELNPDIELNDFVPHLRRILPSEYLSGAFCSSLPVTKAFTDSILKNVNKVLDAKKVA